METIFSEDGTSIAYTKTGNGPALILVDGAMCSSTFGPMPKLVPLLSEHFTVIHFDRRGRGESTDTQPYSPRRELEDISALINTLDKPVYLFGMSSGAILSLMAAADNLPIAKLVLFEPPFEIEENNNTQNSSNHYHKVKDLIATNDRSGAVKYFMRNIAGIPSFVIAIMHWLPIWKKMKANANALPYDLEITKSFTLQNLDDQSISIPTLIAYGGKSENKMQKAAQAASDRMKYSVTQMLEGQNHNVSMKVLAPTLIDFFTDRKKSQLWQR